MSIRITAKKDGFRRGGLVHQGTVYYDDGYFTEDQLEILKAEPNLDVAVIDDSVPDDQPPADGQPTEEQSSEDLPGDEQPAAKAAGKTKKK